MKNFQTGIIDIGSHSVRLDIFDVRGRSGGTLLETLSCPVELGFDVFRSGAVSAESINHLSSIMRGFAAKLAEYNIVNCRTVATSAIREAFNRELVISRIKYETSLEIEILEEQEEARLTFMAVREELRLLCEFDKLSGIAFIVGTGSLLVIYFENGLLRFCEAVPLGTVRVYDEFGRAGIEPEQIVAMLHSTAVTQRVKECAGKMSDKKFLLVGIGAGIRRLSLCDNAAQIMSSDKAAALAGKALTGKPEQLVETLHIPDYLAISIPPCGALINYFLDKFPCDKFVCPATTTRSAILSDIIRSRGARNQDDPFLADMLGAADSLGRKYCFDARHARRTADVALLFFDKLKSFYGLSPRSRIWLEIAALLHDIGRFVDVRQHHKHSYYLITNTQLPGLSESERRIIGTVARYHRKSPPKAGHPEYMLLDPQEKVIVLKLAAILRVADALEQSNHGSIAGLTLQIHGDELKARIADSDINLERIYLQNKGSMFADVYGLKLTVEEAFERI